MNDTHKERFFGTDGIRGKVGGVVINPRFALDLGSAIGKTFLSLGNSKSVAILGKDTRVSGYMLESALQAGLVSAGVDVSVLGTAPTPAIAYLVRETEANFGIVISASHNPYFDNGFKIFDFDGNKITDEIQFLIEAEFEKDGLVSDWRKIGRVRRIESDLRLYKEFCEGIIHSRGCFSGLSIVMDCANGAAYKIAPQIFEKTGASLTLLGTEPNGFNINENCGSTDTKVLQATVIEQKADIGISFDGDGDRLLLVNHKGEMVDGDQIIFALAAGKNRLGTLKGGVVGTQMSNFGLQAALSRLGIPFERVEVGDRHVKKRLLERGWVLGAETSGHILNLDISHTGDGIVAALQILNLMHSTNASLEELVSGFGKAPQVLINVPVKNPGLTMQTPRLIQAIDDYQAQLGKRGRVYIRASGTEPLVRVMVESDDLTEIEIIAKELSDIIENES